MYFLANLLAVVLLAHDHQFNITLCTGYRLLRSIVHSTDQKNHLMQMRKNTNYTLLSHPAISFRAIEQDFLNFYAAGT